MESEQVTPMGASDVRLRRPDEGATSHDVLASDDQPVDAVRSREDQSRDGIVGTAELEAVGGPDREVGLLPRLE